MLKGLLVYRGKRIRVSDKELVVHTALLYLLPIFLSVLCILNLRQLLTTRYADIKLQDILHLSSYHIFTVAIAVVVCIGCFLLYYYFRYDDIKKLQHRQKLARMVLENKWYEESEDGSAGFFKDLPSSNKKKITWFPKIYYNMDHGLLHIWCEISMGKYQDQLLELEAKLESGLYCELKDKLYHDGYVEYILLYDMIANRISIDEVKAEDGALTLMENIRWEYDSLPHALISGGTGGGKTYFLLTLIETLLRMDSVLYILDPKKADLADLHTVMDDVYSDIDDMVECIHNFYEAMVQRSIDMKTMPNYVTGKNYAYLGLAPHFLILDEYVAFMECLNRERKNAVVMDIKRIAMLGRQAGYFLIIACQRPDAKYFEDGIRDQFNFRVALGRMSELGYGMMFGGDVRKRFFQKQIRGRGYCDMGTGVITEFYTPLVPENHNFLQEIGGLAYQRKKTWEQQEKAETDEKQETEGSSV